MELIHSLSSLVSGDGFAYLTRLEEKQTPHRINSLLFAKNDDNTSAGWRESEGGKR